MKTILINLNSIKKNPEYNPFHYKKYIIGHKEITFECDELPSFLIDEENCFITEWKHDGEKKVDIKGYMNEPLIVIDIIKEEAEKTNLIISYKAHMIDITSLSDMREYLYTYCNTLVKCKECGIFFLSKDFRNLETEGCSCCGCGYNLTDRGCPECGEYDCVEVQYETIEEALKRIKRKIK